MYAKRSKVHISFLFQRHCDSHITKYHTDLNEVSLHTQTDTNLNETYPYPKTLLFFKKHSFPKQGSFPCTEHHDPRPTFCEGTETCTVQSPTGASSEADSCPCTSELRDQG